MTGGVTAVRAVPSLLGSRVELTWRNPSTDALGGGHKLAGIRILRRERTYPIPAGNPLVMPTDGTLVYPSPSAAFGPVISSFSDIGLRPLTTYYYSVYAVFEPVPATTAHRFLADDESRAAGFATDNYGLADRLYRLLPAVHQRLDRPLTAAEVDRLRVMNGDAALALNALAPALRERGQLRRFLGAAGAPVDLMRSLAEGLPQLHDVDIARADYLPALAAWVGWEPDRTIPVFEQRNEIKFAPYRYRTVGTVPNIRSIVTRYGRWYPQIAEFAEQIARSNITPQLNTFWVAEGFEVWHGGDDAAPVLGFVGANSTATGSGTNPARLTSLPGPFGLRPGMELAVTADERIPIVVRFGLDDFVNIAQATATEVAAVLNRTLSEVTASVTPPAPPPPPPTSRVVISSNTVGPASSLRVERYDANLVTLEGAPRGRLALVADPAPAPLADRVRLFYETADPHTPATTIIAAQALNGPPFPRRPLPGEKIEPAGPDPATFLPSRPQGQIRCKTFRAGTWSRSFPLLDPAALPHGEPAAVQLTGPNRLWVAWVENPNTASSRLRFRVGTPRATEPARLVSRRGEPFFIRPRTGLVLRGRRPAAGLEFRTTDFALPPIADGTQRATAAEVRTALNARLAGFVVASVPANGSGAIQLATANAGGDEWLAVDLRHSTAAPALGLDSDTVAIGDWGDEIDWTAPENVPAASVPGFYAEPSAVVIPAAGPGPETVFLCWARHDGSQWLVEAATASLTGTTWNWSPAEVVTNSGFGDREPCAVPGPTPSGSVRVFWSRRELTTRHADEDCWTLWCRDRTGGTWGAETQLTMLVTTTLPPQRDIFADREPGAVRTAAAYRLFFRTNRGGGANLASINVPFLLTGSFSQPGLVTTGAPNDHWPAPFFWPTPPPATRPQLRLLFRSDRSVPLSRVSTQTPPRVDNRVTSTPRSPAATPAPQPSLSMPDTGTAHRFCGATSVTLGDAARIARRQEWDDLLTYTPERPERHQSPEAKLTGKPGDPDFKLADDIWYTRGTIGLFLSPFAPQDPQFEDFRERLRPVLDRFLPINVRAVVRLRPRIFTEFVYTPTADIGEFTSFTAVSPFVESYPAPGETSALPLPWGVLRAANLANLDDPVPIDLSADPADLTTLRRRTFFLQADEEGLMRKTEFPATELHGMYRDIVRDAGGNVISDTGWRKNLILDGFRRLLASFAHGPGTLPSSNALGIEEVRFGRGDPAWDTTPPTPDPTRTALTDAAPIPVRRFLTPPPPNAPNPDFQIRFLVNNAASATETNVVEVVATLAATGPGPGITLREFGVVGNLNAAQVLLNHVAHPAIVKDPTTTLTRTIRFVF